MFSISIKHVILFIFPFLIIMDLQADDLPDTSSPTIFKAELRALSRHNNLPNIDAEDDFIGVKFGATLLADQAQNRHLVHAARASLYPNTGYNVWAQISQWAGDTPHFAVSIGVQYEYSGANPHLRRAIGLGWSEIYGRIHTQRDIQGYGLIGRSSPRVEYGLAGGMALHHVLVEDGQGIPDYDETFIRLMPYISMMLVKGHYIQLILPSDNKGSVLNVSYEIQFGARK